MPQLVKATRGLFTQRSPSPLKENSVCLFLSRNLLHVDCRLSLNIKLWSKCNGKIGLPAARAGLCQFCSGSLFFRAGRIEGELGAGDVAVGAAASADADDYDNGDADVVGARL